MCLSPRRVDTQRIGPGEQRREPDSREVERYEPLPGILELPGWAWGKVGRSVRIAAAVVLMAAVAVGVGLALTLRGPAAERERAEQRERAERRTQLIRRLRAEQQPRFARSRFVAAAGAPGGRRLTARTRLLEEVASTILADARRRARLGQLDGSFRRTDCEPFPRTIGDVGAERDLSRRSGRYSCVAVKAEFKRTKDNVGGVLGQQYRAQVDFRTGRYAYCKIAGQAGPTRDPLATTPRACGGT